MSLAVAAAPTIKRPPIATPEEVTAFRERHIPEVEAAIRLMSRKIHPGVKFRQIITPLRTAVHDKDSSPVREDFARVGCPNSILMRGLFREMCPRGIDMTFDFETTSLWIPDPDDPQLRHREDVTQMVIYFYVPKKTPRASRKMR